MSVELNVIEDVLDYLGDIVSSDSYIGEGLNPYGCDLWTLLFEEPNANGTLDFSREESYQYLAENSGAQTWILNRLINELGYLSLDDIYEYNEESSEEILHSYIYDNAESIKVNLFIEIGQVVLEMCSCVREHWDEPFDLNDLDLVEELRNELGDIRPVDVANQIF